MKKEKANPPSQVQSDHKTSSRDPYLKNLCRYWRLQEDQEKTPLRPASVGDIMLPSDFLHIFPSPSWTIPKLQKAENGYFKSESVRASVVCENYPSLAPLVSAKPWRICVFSWILSENEWVITQLQRTMYQIPEVSQILTGLWEFSEIFFRNTEVLHVCV